MELNDKEARKVKEIYSDYHEGAMSPEDALYELELLINNDNEEN